MRRVATAGPDPRQCQRISPPQASLQFSSSSCALSILVEAHAVHGVGMRSRCADCYRHLHRWVIPHSSQVWGAIFGDPYVPPTVGVAARKPMTSYIKLRRLELLITPGSGLADPPRCGWQW